MPGTKLGQEKQAAARCGLPLEEWRARRASGQARCYACKEWKPNEAFAKDGSRPTGRASICKRCSSLAATRSRYGLSRDEFEALPGADGVCPICQRGGQKMHVDHNHHTGAVRGMLCTRCNVGLGQFRDDRNLIARAIEYLESHQ